MLARLAADQEERLAILKQARSAPVVPWSTQTTRWQFIPSASARSDSIGTATLSPASRRLEKMERSEPERFFQFERFVLSGSCCVPSYMYIYTYGYIYILYICICI